MRNVAGPGPKDRPRHVPGVTQSQRSAELAVVVADQQPEREIRERAYAVDGQEGEHDADDDDVDAEVLRDPHRDAGEQPALAPTLQRRPGSLRRRLLAHRSSITPSCPARIRIRPGAVPEPKFRVAAVAQPDVASGVQRASSSSW